MHFSYHTPVLITHLYLLGASVIRMMANFLGLQTFKRGVTSYLNANKFSNARQDDLWEALTNVARTDGVLKNDLTVKEIMDTCYLLILEITMELLSA